MLLKSITIENFLPYKEKKEVVFSTDPEKNVTLIKGDNGAGKTSIAQAFQWCLYAKTTYADNRVINAEILQAIAPGTHRVVSVTTKLVHDDIFYTITRSQRYSRSATGRIEKPDQAEFDIQYRAISDGQTNHVPSHEQGSRIDELLSNELSHYFFFDGEHVKKMRAEVEKGKSTDFANAVKSLLGLQHIANALVHLQASGNRSSVMRSFRARYNEEGDSVLVSGTKEIETFETRIEKLRKDITAAEEEQDIASSEKQRYRELLEENKESESVVRSLEASKRKIKTHQAAYLSSRKAVVDEFRSDQFLFFGQRLIVDALKELDDEKQIDKGVPDVTDKTIEFLIKERKQCICGADLSNDLNAINHLTELLKFIPPQSIGTSIAGLIKECGVHLSYLEDFPSKLAGKYKTMREAQRSIVLAEKERDAWQSKFDSMNNVDISHLRKLFSQKEREESRAIERKGAARQNITRTMDLIEQTQNKIASVTIQNENNKKIKKYLEYTNYVRDYLQKIYSDQEESVKKEFEEAVNSFFKQIYEGELYLQFDEDYGITVCVKGINHAGDDWKTSTGQTLAITLAFVAGILKIARKNFEDTKGLLAGNTYPLVMDAPLSEFDTTRIERICEVFPEVAEQIIIIAFDKDASLIEEHLGDRIGKRWEIKKISDSESFLEEK